MKPKKPNLKHIKHLLKHGASETFLVKAYKLDPKIFETLKRKHA